MADFAPLERRSEPSVPRRLARVSKREDRIEFLEGGALHDALMLPGDSPESNPIPRRRPLMRQSLRTDAELAAAKHEVDQSNHIDNISNPVA